MTIKTLQEEWVSKISPLDFFVLASHILQKAKTWLLAHPEYELVEEAQAKLTQACQRRANHEPVAYITGHKEFYGRNFQVTRDTLIPRPETEILIEEVLRYLRGASFSPDSLDIVDVGAGSGNIIITLAHEIESHPHFYALDISEAALRVAQMNYKNLQTSHLITFFESNVLGAYLRHTQKMKHLIIVANLPYLSEEIYSASHRDVREYEPKQALFSKEAGLSHYYKLLEQIHGIRTDFESVAFFLEISPEQSIDLTQKIKGMFEEGDISIVPDLSGKDRIVKVIL